MSAFMFLAVLGAMAIPSGVEVSADNCVAQLSADGQVRVQLCLPKKEFIEAEPIIVQTALQNCGTEPRLLGEPSWDFGTVSHVIVQLEGDQPIPPKDMDCRAALPDDYGWTFDVNESRSSAADLQNDYGPMPAGKYTVRAIYEVPDHVRGVWHGRIETGELTFTIVKAVGRYEQVAKVFADRGSIYTAKDKTQRALQLAHTYRLLQQPSEGGAFARYAGFWEGTAYLMGGHKETALRAYRDYAERWYPEVPFYGERALVHAAGILQSAGDVDGAREVLLQLPEGYDRAYQLGLCDRREREFAEQDSGRQ